MDKNNISIIEEKSSRNQTKNYEERGIKTMKTQKELKEKFMQVITSEVWPNDKKWKCTQEKNMTI